MIRIACMGTFALFAEVELHMSSEFVFQEIVVYYNPRFNSLVNQYSFLNEIHLGERTIDRFSTAWCRSRIPYRLTCSHCAVPVAIKEE